MSSNLPKPSQFVDISTFPADEKAHIIDLATKHNALCSDVDAISGATPSEKQEFHGLMGGFRRVIHFAHTKRFQIFVAIATMHFALSSLKQLGLSPDQASRLINAIIKIAEKVANG